MNAKDAPAFFAELAKLAVMHRIQMDKATGRVYYEALGDVPTALLVMAMGRLLKHAGEFMPTSERIREVCDDIQHEQHARALAELQRPQSLALSGDVAPERVHYFDCNACLDTGSRKTCPGCSDVETCTVCVGDYCPNYMAGKYRIPVTTCACASTNPTILRRRKAELKPAPFSSQRSRRKRYGGYTPEVD